MGDNSDGSSSAAQSAQDDPNEQPSRGFIGRLFDALSPSDNGEEEVHEKQGPLMPSPMQGMLNLRRMRVEDVAVPKNDIVAAPIGVTKGELVELFRESGLTRIPIYEGTLDTPIGIANLKDFALKYGFNGNKAPLDLREMVRPLLFVPPSMPLGILLQKMQSERIHMALVIDEYGGTDGLVTIEDLIEQVVGAIEDEHDIDEAKSFTCESEGVYNALARTTLEDFEAEAGTDLTAHSEIDEEEVDTLGGLVYMLSGTIPARGEVIFHPDGTEFEVLDADPRRIKRLRVRLPGSRDD
ncbi:MAG: hemolysin family protein [Yoonia sp.]|nr:hemolysin family protein [Yoonia sp.]MDG1861940.1 hemolysin family protein [Yoonia sp.]